ncbi:hypothetical protein Tco_0060612 [Tanacetum coccineum]
MIGTKPNSFYDPNMKTRLGYQNLERLKKSIQAQPKMFYGKYHKCDNSSINLPDFKETLEDAEESQLKMKDKMIQIDYAKLNKLYDSFVPQMVSADQTYLSPPSTSNVTLESSQQKSSLPPKEMSKASQLLKLFVNLEKEIQNLDRLVYSNLKISTDTHFIYDNKSDIKYIFNIDVQPILKSWTSCTKVIKEEITKEVQEMLDVFESMESKVDEKAQNHKTFQNEIDLLLEASLVREVRDCVIISVEQSKMIS